MVIIATLTISTSALGENKAVGGVERGIDRGNYYLGKGRLGKLCEAVYREGEEPKIMMADTASHR